MAISRINGGPEVSGSTVDRVIERIAGAVGGGEEDETEIQRFLLGLMEEAVELAEARFSRAKIPYRKEHYLSLIDRARRAFIH